MARISKPVRGCIYPLISLGLTLVIGEAVEYFIGDWAYLFYLPIFFWLHLFSPVDTFDLWLRRHTKDTYWLMTDEGNEWLETQDGKAWLKTGGAQRWLTSAEAQWWVKTHYKSGT